MKLLLFALFLTALPLAAFNPADPMVELNQLTGRDWVQWPEYERYAFAYGFMMSHFSMAADAGHHYDGAVGDIVRHYGHFPNESPWSFAALVDEIYATPGFRDIPIGVAAQLRHEYVEAIRDGATRPPRIQRGN